MRADEVRVPCSRRCEAGKAEQRLEEDAGRGWRRMLAEAGEGCWQKLEKDAGRG